MNNGNAECVLEVGKMDVSRFHSITEKILTNSDLARDLGVQRFYDGKSFIRGVEHLTDNVYLFSKVNDLVMKVERNNDTSYAPQKLVDAIKQYLR